MIWGGDGHTEVAICSGPRTSMPDDLEAQECAASREQQVANTRLIVTAVNYLPNLLSALGDCMEQIRNFDRYGCDPEQPNGGRLSFASAVITKINKELGCSPQG